MPSGYVKRFCASEDYATEESVEKRRSGGMTATAVFNMALGVLEILNGLFQLIGALVLIRELLRLGVFEGPPARLIFSLLLLATGIVGLVAGIGVLARRPSARTLSLMFGGLLILSSVCSFFVVPIIATIGTYDIRSLSTEGLVRLVVFALIYVALPVSYSIFLFVVFSRSDWRAAFARDPSLTQRAWPPNPRK
jgi:hypothetical protein